MNKITHLFSLINGEYKRQDLAAPRANSYWMHTIREAENRNILINAGVNDSIVDMLFDVTTRPHFVALGNDSFLLFLRAINLNPKSAPEDMVSLRIYYDGNNLFTVMNRPLQAVKALMEKLEKSPQLENSHLNLLSRLIDEILERVAIHLNHLELQVETIEDKVDHQDKVDSSELYDLRRAVSRIWRHMQPQLESLKKLANFRPAFSETTHKLHLVQHVDSVSYFLEELNLLRERNDILENELNGQINAKINRNLYIISIISVIFLPLSFITGLLGINVGGMPGASSDTAFLIVTIGMLLLGVFLLFVLRRFKWF